MVILFVCTGNTCRSPMAEGLMRSELSGEPNIKIISAGIFASQGQPASAYAVKALNELGVDILAHRSQPLNEDLINEADLIIAMTENHRQALLRQYPNSGDKVFTLGGLSELPSDIPDPFGGSIDIYRKTADEIYKRVKAIVEKHKREWQAL